MLDPQYVYEDLFDIEKRPGAGVALWTKAVERQLERVREINFRHRLNHSPNEDERRPDPDAEGELHAEVYFLALAIRRVLLFHDALARQIKDPRLGEARSRFDEEAPGAKLLRDIYEHLDEYLLDNPRKHRRCEIPGRASPVLRSRWDCDNVVVAVGPLQVDVTMAAVNAISLGKATAAVWSDHWEEQRALRERANRVEPGGALHAEAGSSGARIEVTLGVTAEIGGDEGETTVRSGKLLDVRLTHPGSPGGS